MKKLTAVGAVLLFITTMVILGGLAQKSEVTNAENATVQTNTAVETDVTLTKTDSIVITEGGTQTISGTIENGQILVDTGDEDVTIILNGVDVTNSNGSALYIESAGDVTIEIADGSVNKLTQTGLDSNEEEKGALYSTSDLEIIGNGSGTLYVTSTIADGISCNDDLYLTSGTITVEATDDGIRGKDSVVISGGTITVDAEDDGIKSTNSEEFGRGTLTILGGTVTVTSGDDAIKAEQELLISGGTINIPMSSEGIEAPVVTIDGGDITIYATDDGINAATSDIITTGISITINDGNLTIEVGPGDTDAIDANGSITVNGGTIDITAQMSSFDYDTTGVINGGTVTVNGEVVTEMPEDMMGGGGRGGRAFPNDGTRPTPPSMQ